MGKEPLFATATASSIRLPVPVGEIDTPDGTVFNTTQPRPLYTKKQAEALDRAWKNSQDPALKSWATYKTKRLRKLERQNRKKGRKNAKH